MLTQPTQTRMLTVEDSSTQPTQTQTNSAVLRQTIHEIPCSLMDWIANDEAVQHHQMLFLYQNNRQVVQHYQRRAALLHRHGLICIAAHTRSGKH